MGFRLRHCIECPECRTRYLIGFSPYCNGSHLTLVWLESREECRLVCACCRPAACSQRGRRELEMYRVSYRAYKRGYGTPEEIRMLTSEFDSKLEMKASRKGEEQCVLDGPGSS